ncbi:MAG: hypothetical protein JWO20_3224 [Candidatus Angelobacter sp.]|nr:hypothetical protein [Candidatus Angelobacter sp.]
MQLPPRSVTTLLLVLFGFTFILSATLPTVEIGKWSPGPDLARPLTNASAVVLSDGSLFISGGNSTNGPVAAAQIFSGGAFGSAGSMSVARADHASVVLNDGRVLVTGGTTASGATNQAELFDPANGSWSAAGNLLDARSGHTASLLHDGRVLIAGGAGSGGPISSLELFDPDTNNFSAAGALASARSDHAAVVLSNGHVLIIGGSDGSQALASTEIFNPGDGSVSAGANLSTPRAKASATTLLDGRIAVIGGNNGSADLSSAELYSGGSFSSVSDHLAQARSGHLAILLPHNNSVLIVGGSAAGNDLASAELFAPWSGFNSTGSLASPRNGSVGAPLDSDGLLIVAGGSNSSSTELYGFATLKTDANDYPAGTPVHITGKGWQPGETVTLSFLESPNLDQHPAIQTVADSNGNISDSSFAPDDHDIDVRFYLTATGSVSTAQTTFTDSKPNGVTLNPTSITVSPGGTATYTVTVAFNGNNTPCTSPLSVTSGLPAGATASFSPSSVSTPDGSSQTSTLTITTTAATPNGTNTITVLAGNGGGTCQTGTATGTGTLIVGARKVASVSVGAQTGTLIFNTAGSATYAVTVTRGASGTFSANLTLTTALPIGATASFSPSSVSFAASDTSKTSTLTISTTAATPAGSTTFTAQAANPAMPGDSATGNGTLLIGNATQTITFGALANKTYGDAPFTVSATGGASGNPVTFSSTTAPVCTTSGTNGSTVTIVSTGTCTIKASQAGNSSYNAATDVNQSFTIAKATLTITADNKSRNYGDANPAFTVSYGGFVNGETLATSGVTGTPTATTTATPSSSTAGSPYAITAAIGTLASGNYAFSFVAGQLTINKAVLTVTATDASRGYGDANPAFTATYTGFKNGETLATSGVSGTPSTSSAATPASSVAGSPYPITIAIGSLVAANYSFVFVNGNLTINKAVLTVTAADGSRGYGDPNPAFTATYSGFKNGETLATSGVTGTPGTSSAATPASSVAGSPYPITVAIGSLASANYSFVFANGKLTINKAVLTVTATDISREYGDANPANTVTYAGFKNGETLATSGVTGTPSTSTTATPASSVAGSPYPITAAIGSLLAANYSFVFVNGNLTIIKAVLTVTAPDISREYGDANPTFTATYTGFKNGESLGTSGVSGAPSTSTTATPASSVAGSPYPITAAIGSLVAANYSFVFVNGSLTINKAVLTVTATDISREYGDANPAFTATYTGFKNGETLATSGVTGTPSTSTTATPASFVAGSPYAITAAIGSLASANYSFVFANGKLTITAAPLSITPANANREYGDPNPAFTGTITGIKNSDAITATYVSAATAASSVAGSPYEITATVNDPDHKLSNYNLTSNVGHLTISAAPLTVTPANASRLYGAANPAFTGNITGIKNSDNITAAYASTATSGSSVAGSPYDITATLVDLDHKLANYLVTSNVGHLTISPAPLSVKADDKNRFYGAANPAFTGTVTGVVNGDDITATFTTIAVASSNIGTYPITPALADPSHRLGNYDITSTDGTLVITKAPLSVTINDKTRFYGAANPPFTGTVIGIVNGDNITASYSTTAVASSNIGTYPITSTLADPDNRLGNYDVTSTNGVLTVNKASLSVKADDKNRFYGAANPAFTGTVTGVVNGDDITATYSTLAVIGSNIGTYPITPALADPDHRLGNYDIVSTDGTLAIIKAALTVSADDKSRTYGAVNPAFTGTLAGVVNGDNITASYSTAAVTGSNIGTYAITPALADPDHRLGNYDLTSTNGTLTIGKASLSVTADSKSRVYGSANPALTGTITGVVNGDNITATYSTTALVGSNIGTYPITPTLADPNNRLGNYDLTVTDATLIITKASLSVLADSKSRSYGALNPTFTGTLTGVVNSDNITAAYNSAATQASNVGSYPITPTLLDPNSRLGNYAVTITNGSLTINPALLSITADNKSKIFNGANPTLTATYSGFVLSQSSADLAGTLSCGTTALLNSLVGGYPISCSGQTSTNYAISYVAGTLRILYSTLACGGSAGHTILQPINPDGTSVFKQGSTTPAKFRVCDANGVSIGSAGVVSTFKIVNIQSGTVSQIVNEDPLSTTPDTTFRWDPTAQQWIYNVSSKSLNPNSTYTFAITLNDGSTIPFMYGLK